MSKLSESDKEGGGDSQPMPPVGKTLGVSKECLCDHDVIIIV